MASLIGISGSESSEFVAPLDSSHSAVEAHARDYNLDVLKALSTAFVLLWHVQPIRFPSPRLGDHISRLPGYLVAIFYWQVTLVAVPIFLLVALRLFYAKCLQDRSYFLSRTRRLGGVWLFWVSVQILVYLGTLWGASLLHLEDWIKRQPLSTWLPQGGPALPVTGGSVFFFVQDLIMLNLAAYALLWVKRERRVVLSYVLVLVMLAYFEVGNILGSTIPYWRLDSFFIYIPAAYLLLVDERIARWKPALLVLWLVFSAHDVILRDHLGRSMGAYSRASMFFGALYLFTLVSSARLDRTSQAISNLAKHSLGWFALHKYWVLLVTFALKLLLRDVHVAQVISIGGVELSLYHLFAGCAIFALTGLSVYAMSRTPLRRFVS